MADRVIPSRNSRGEFLPFSVAAPALADYRKGSYRPALSRDLQGRYVSEDVEAAGLVRGGANRKELSFKEWCRQELMEPEHETRTGRIGARAGVRANRSPTRRSKKGKVEARKALKDYRAGKISRGEMRKRFRRADPRFTGGRYKKSGQRDDVGGFEIRRGHWKGEEVGRGRSRHRYSGNPLTSERRKMPASEFALPISAQSAKFKASHPKNAGAYPMFDRAHAANARSRATQMLNSGWLTVREAQTIYNRTSDRWGFEYKKLVHSDRTGKWKSVKVESKPRLRAAANRHSPYNLNW